MAYEKIILDQWSVKNLQDNSSLTITVIPRVEPLNRSWSGFSGTVHEPSDADDEDAFCPVPYTFRADP